MVTVVLCLLNLLLYQHYSFTHSLCISHPVHHILYITSCTYWFAKTLFARWHFRHFGQSQNEVTVCSVSIGIANMQDLPKLLNPGSVMREIIPRVLEVHPHVQSSSIRS